MKRLALVAITALLFTLMPVDTQAQEPFIGEIRLMGTSYCPQNWAEADGSLLQVSQYAALFSLYDCEFGGNCTTTFALPDLRGRVPVGIGAGPGLTPRNRGTIGGAETEILSVSQLPTHKHSLSDVTLKGTVQVASSAGTTNAPSGKALSDSGRTSLYSDGTLDASLIAGSVSVSGQSDDEVAAAGESQPHNNMPPFVALRYCVSLDGIFPERPD